MEEFKEAATKGDGVCDEEWASVGATEGLHVGEAILVDADEAVTERLAVAGGRLQKNFWRRDGWRHW